MKRLACSKCNEPIGLKKIFHWLDGGTDPLNCASCKRTIVSEGEQLGVYILMGLLSALGLFFMDEISSLLLGFGVDIPGVLLALGIAALSISVVWVAVIVVVYIRS